MFFLDQDKPQNEQTTPLKFNSSPLKNGGSGRLLPFLLGETVTFQGFSLAVKLRFWHFGILEVGDFGEVASLQIYDCLSVWEHFWEASFVKPKVSGFKGYVEFMEIRGQ